ncbi:MAG: 50S ribosomal protein L5 [Candidatus Ratteibacteria bacterium]|nr:50S ribosomal protein L5 [Candidatus Ratteibacteria bacterium]
MEPRLKTHYKEKVIPELMKTIGYKNPHQVPRLIKVVLNAGIGKDNKDAKLIESVQKEMAMITGQKPIITRTRKSIAGFNLRKGDICGIMVTLRGNRMYEFLDRMITVALPRVRDFNGLPASSTDNRGGYTIGIKEQVIFPEIDYNLIYKTKGMNVCLVTTAKTKKETVTFLRKLGLPIREE